MKQYIDHSEIESLPLSNQLFLALWKTEKKYPRITEWSFGEILELALSLTPDLRFETPSERTIFNNSLQYEEMLVGWDGEEPIDILWYEVNQKLKRRINQYLVVKESKV